MLTRKNLSKKKFKFSQIYGKRKFKPTDLVCFYGTFVSAFFDL